MVYMVFEGKAGEKVGAHAELFEPAELLWTMKRLRGG